MSMISVRGLRKVYRGRRREPVPAVDGVSFEIAPGEVVGLLGPNGAGKTTTIKCLCTLVLPTAGDISLDGVDAVRAPRAAVGKVAAVLEGNRNVYWRLTVRENLEFFAALQGTSRRKLRVEIDGLIDRFRLGEKSRTPARMLSKGMQQKLALACTFVKGAPLLVLDEPTLGLDVEASHELRGLLKESAAGGGRTILLSSHDMAVVQDVCDRVIILNRGRIVTDDRISNLLALFEARAYRFTITGTLAPERQRALLERFPLGTLTADGETSRLDVELLDPSGFYSVVDALRDERVAIESVDRTYPNLEEVFLKVVREGTAR